VVILPGKPPLEDDNAKSLFVDDNDNISVIGLPNILIPDVLSILNSCPFIVIACGVPLLLSIIKFVVVDNIFPNNCISLRNNVVPVKTRKDEDTRIFGVSPLAL